MSLLSQPVELITAQLLLLDLNSIRSVAMTHPLLNEICNETFWREKLKHDFPEYIPDSSSYKESYSLITHPNPSLLIRTDRVDLLELLFNRGEIPTDDEFVTIAAKSSSKRALSWLLGRQNLFSCWRGHSWVMRKGTPDLSELFKEKGVLPSNMNFYTSASAGAVEQLKWLLTQFDNVPPDLFRWLLTLLNSCSEKKRRRMLRTIAWLDEESLFLERDEGDVAVVLEQVERLLNCEIGPVNAVEYGFRLGSEQLVKALMKRGYDVDWIELLSVERVKWLTGLGVKVDREKLIHCRDNPSLFFHFVDSGLVNCNYATALIITEPRERSRWSLIDELERRRLPLSREGIKREFYALRNVNHVELNVSRLEEILSLLEL